MDADDDDDGGGGVTVASVPLDDPVGDDASVDGDGDDGFNMA